MHNDNAVYNADVSGEAWERGFSALLAHVGGTGPARPASNACWRQISTLPKLSVQRTEYTLDLNPWNRSVERNLASPARRKREGVAPRSYINRIIHSAAMGQSIYVSGLFHLQQGSVELPAPLVGIRQRGCSASVQLVFIGEQWFPLSCDFLCSLALSLAMQARSQVSTMGGGHFLTDTISIAQPRLLRMASLACTHCALGLVAGAGARSSNRDRGSQGPRAENPEL